MASGTYNPIHDHPQSSYGNTAFNNSNSNNMDYAHANESTGYITPLQTSPPRKRGVNKWIKFGIPLAIVIIVAAVVAGVVASRKKNSDSSASGGSSSSSDGGSGTGGTNGAGSAGSGRFATATDTQFMVPIYPSTTNAAFTSPTFLASSKANAAWPADTFTPTTPSITNMRPDRPRLIAPKYKWDALPDLIKKDVYMQGWNATLFSAATEYASRPVLAYVLDGSSGILDLARETKMRVKAFAYAYRMSKDTKWVDRTWDQLENAATFGPDTDKWNPTHFLDTAEFSAAFGIAYDWLYDIWTPTQKDTIRNALITNGLRPGLAVFQPAGTSYGWWSQSTITGNWNCVCNGGLTLGALAILEDDTTGVAAELLGYTVDNANSACVNAVADDGSWAETANYWYFGTTGHAEMASALLTATGSDFGLLTKNSNFKNTGKYHMNVFGQSALFNYGDHGPNKFSTTANSMFLYAAQYKIPEYALFQREQVDAATDPWSMFWYDPTVSGAFWSGAPLDTFFDNGLDQWAAMRSSWTDEKAVYLAIKAGKNQGHQTHNDLDAGDFVLDALGTRWAGEFGSGDYNSIEYFTSDEQDAARWKYYRKGTVGQNVLLVDKANQDVKAAPTVTHGSTGDEQGGSTVTNVKDGSAAYWVADLTSAYFSATSVKRGARLLNKRRQVLVQDEITASAPLQWRMHTNATISIDDASPTTATLSLDSQTLVVSLLNAPSGARFSTLAPVRFDSSPEPPQPDSPNPGVSVLVVDLAQAGTYSLQVLFNPQWPGMAKGDYVEPAAVSLDKWSVTSHN